MYVSLTSTRETAGSEAVWDMYSKEEIDRKCKQGTFAWMQEHKTHGKAEKYEGYLWFMVIMTLLLFILL